MLGKTLSELCAQRCLLFCIIVAQPGTLFLFLKLLSGNVRLTSLRKTGSDGKEKGRGTNSEGEEEERKSESKRTQVGKRE